MLNKMVSFLVLAAPFFCTTVADLSPYLALEDELARLTREFRSENGPAAEELVDLVASMARDAAKSRGETRVDIDWRALMPVKAWTLSTTPSEQLEIKVWRAATRFTAHWAKVYPRVPINHRDNITISVCWLGNESCMYDDGLDYEPPD